jgi:peptide subunit release factor 1 (eRF1)
MKKAVAGYRSRMEEAKLNNLIDDISSKAVVGAQKVISALNQDRVRELVLSPDLNLIGFSCPEKHYFAVEKPDEDKCPYCDKELIEENYLENDLIEHAFLHGAEIFHIVENRGKFKNQNVGAFLRY